MAADERVSLEVVAVRAEALGILVFDLRRADGAPPAGIEPGAHLELELDNGLIRHYSLTNDPATRDRYIVAVGRAENSAGGSSFLHEKVRCGTRLNLRAVRNNFRLDPAAGRYLFIAGGIGVTPILSMVRWCEAEGRDWRLVYAARSAQRAAFTEALKPFGDRVRFHFDDEAGQVLDARELLSRVAAEGGEQVYCCGPGPLMAAVKEAGAHLDPAALHFEYFTAPTLTEAEAEAAAAARASDGAFSVVLKSDGRKFEVPADKSVLEVLEANGLAIPFSCREGMCRTCETSVCEGEIDHRDYVLSEDERQGGHTMMLCVSRAKSPRLVLDL